MQPFRRGVRVVEGARLESVYTRKGIAGSNPALSAKQIDAPNGGICYSGERDERNNVDIEGDKEFLVAVGKLVKADRITNDGTLVPGINLV